MWILHLARLVSSRPSVGFGMAYYWLDFFFFKVKNTWFCVDNLKADSGRGPAVLLRGSFAELSRRVPEAVVLMTWLSHTPGSISGLHC